MTVLVAEDNEDIRELVCLQLRDMGLEVFSAENGERAVELAWAEHPTLVLMDMNMPVMNGFEAVRTLRERGYVRPIVGLTAYQDGPEADMALECGCDQLMHKPLRAAQLREKVLEIIRKVNAAETGE